MPPRRFTAATIRKAVAQLEISARPAHGDPFRQRLFVRMPEAFEALRSHDIDQGLPPEGMSLAAYDWMRPVFRVMIEATKRHFLYRAVGIIPRLQDRLRADLGHTPAEDEIISAYRAFLLDDLRALQDRSEFV
jgi:hypothetical protein